MLPCRSMAVILLPALTACMYCWLPSSARMGVSPGFQAQMRPLESTKAACVVLTLIAVTAEWLGKNSDSVWLCPLSR